jgi:alcohol dehydrogenase (NADP+)
MKTLKFRNGDQLDAIGLGTWKSEKGKVEDAVYTALKTGYTHIDCALVYGNEAEVGNGINKALKEGILSREELWVTSKLWNNAHKKEDVIPALKQSLKDLQLDYLDLYLIHWPVAFRPEVKGFPETDDDYLSLEEAPIIDTWNAMLEAKKLGLIKHIGVSNFSVKKLKNLIEKTDFSPEMNQVELHPMLQQEDLVNFCHENDIHLTAYSPLGSGDRVSEMKANDEPDMLGNEIINDIANKHNSSPAQVLIAFHLHRNTAVIPKSTNAERIKENLKSANLKFDKEDLENLKSLDQHYRFVNGKFFENNSKYSNIYDE